MHPVETVERLKFFDGMRGSDFSIEKVLEAHRISIPPPLNTRPLHTAAA